MKYKIRKKYQRKLNKMIRDINKYISNDPLWRGRFVFHSMMSDWEEFSDKSGGLLHIVLRGIDKKEEEYYDYKVEYAPWLSQWKLWLIVNKFITQDTHVYKNGADPYKDVVDYNKIKINNRYWDLKWNPYNFTGVQ